ncbi:MAG TPA: CYTH and CHAD domain-containing protein [Acidimicrobiales bacterium]|nr:CYTH and CHAD domain-containing protein [Acidimicrobiales bacterium]
MGAAHVEHSAHVEHEVKLEAGVGFSVPDFEGIAPGVLAEAMPDARLQAVYYDTPDLRLMRNGITLRYRQDRQAAGTGERGWTLKLRAPPDGKGLVRKELTWAGGRTAPPRPAADLVRALSHGRCLGPVARLVTLRRRTLLTDAAGGALLEVDDDIVSVMDGRRLAARFREVEVEVVGSADLLDAVVERLRDAGAVPGDDRPKVVRALGRRATAPPDVVVPALGSEASVKEMIGAAIAAGYTRLVDHDPGVRLDEDPEDVHQARVATRRLRSDLRSFARLLDDAWTRTVREELGWLARALGAVRDADVLGDRLAGRVGDLAACDRAAAEPLLRRLAAQRKVARRDLRTAMDSDRYLALLDTLVVGALDPPVGLRGAGEAGCGPEVDAGGAPEVEGGGPAVDGSAPAIEMVPRLVRPPWRNLDKAVGDLGDDPADDALHEVRIMAKRLRYACEAVAPVAGKAARRTAKDAAALQSVLGDHHDAVVAEGWLRAAARQDGGARSVVTGQLIAGERRVQDDARRQWRRPWRALADKHRRDWFR